MAVSDYAKLLGNRAADLREVFTAAAEPLGTLPSYAEKDLWVCLTLDALFNAKSAPHRLLFKGGSSLSKGYDLIKRFSEDIDLVVFREDLGFAGDRDPTEPGIGTNERRRRFEALQAACGAYLHEAVRADLKAQLVGLPCEVTIADDDPDNQTLLVEYRSVFEDALSDYVRPRVRIEGGARSGLDPHETRAIVPFAQAVLPEHELSVENVCVLKPVRTFWEKVLILHGIHCTYRDRGENILPDRNRISRHYYDVAMFIASPMGEACLAARDVLDAVRAYNLLAFPQPKKRFEEAVAGSLRLVPQARVRQRLEQDYAAMRSMISGEAPGFDWILDRVAAFEAQLNNG